VIGHYLTELLTLYDQQSLAYYDSCEVTEDGQPM